MNLEDPFQHGEELLRKSLDIKYEWSVLMQAQDNIDQLQIMQEIFSHQITVMTDFEKAIRVMFEKSDQGASTLARTVAAISEITFRREELKNLEKRLSNTRSQASNPSQDGRDRD